MNFSIILLLIMMAGMMYFTSRQQKKQAQQRQEQMNSLSKGDEVVTIGGMYAIVDEVDKEAKKIVLDVEGVFLTFELSAIKSVVTKAKTVVAEVVEEAPAVEVVEVETVVEQAIEE